MQLSSMKCCSTDGQCIPVISYYMFYAQVLVSQLYDNQLQPEYYQSDNLHNTVTLQMVFYKMM